MSAMGWVLVGLGAWLAQSVPVALLMAWSVDSAGDDAVDLADVATLPVIAEADRYPLPPNLRADSTL